MIFFNKLFILYAIWATIYYGWTFYTTDS